VLHIISNNNRLEIDLKFISSNALEIFDDKRRRHEIVPTKTRVSAPITGALAATVRSTGHKSKRA